MTEYIATVQSQITVIGTDEESVKKSINSIIRNKMLPRSTKIVKIVRKVV
jgi:hypothetical protein